MPKISKTTVQEDKEYVKVEAVIYKEGGWSEKEMDDLMDEFIEEVEELNTTSNATITYAMYSEEQLEEEEE